MMKRMLGFPVALGISTGTDIRIAEAVAFFFRGVACAKPRLSSRQTKMDILNTPAKCGKNPVLASVTSGPLT